MILRVEFSGNLASVNTATDVGTQRIKEGIEVSSRSIEWLSGKICILHSSLYPSVNDI